MAFPRDFLLAELTLLVNGDVLMGVKNSTSPSLKFTVPFDEADGEGIVFFGNYFRLAHRALEQYLPTIGISWHDWFANKEWGVPLRHVEAEYLQPLRPGEEFTVGIHVEKIGTSTVVFAYEFASARGEIAARLKTTHIFVERNTFQKREIPEVLHCKLVLEARASLQKDQC
jgi:YbgC/YbaW family acyl-CoA thioester hydrolase